MSGGPSVAVVTRGRKDWLGAEAEDGTIYRALLSIAEGVSRGGRPTLPLDQVEARWSWWKERPRTEAWAARYGGEFQAVQELFINSQAALDADRRRQEQERLNALALENQRQEADRAERRRLEEHAHQQELLARARARTNWIIGGALCVALIFAGVAGWAWWTATQQRDQARATSIWSRLVLKDPRLSRDEIDAVWELALAPRSVKHVFVRQLGEKPSYLARFGERPLPIINALGLQLPEEEKKALLDHELAGLGNTKDPDLIGVPERALAATAPWFDQAQSDAALASLLDVADKATENEDWGALGGAITKFAPHITASMGLIAHRRIISGLMNATEPRQASAFGQAAAAYVRFPADEPLKHQTELLFNKVFSMEAEKKNGQLYLELLAALQGLTQNLSSHQAASLIEIMLQHIDNTSTEFQNVATKLANVLTGEDANGIQERITQAQAALNDEVQQSLLVSIAVGLSAHLPSSLALKELQIYLKK